jgi:hypothetical protein
VSGEVEVDLARAQLAAVDAAFQSGNEASQRLAVKPAHAQRHFDFGLCGPRFQREVALHGVAQRVDRRACFEPQRCERACIGREQHERFGGSQLRAQRERRRAGSEQLVAPFQSREGECEASERQGRRRSDIRRQFAR